MGEKVKGGKGEDEKRKTEERWDGMKG